MPRISHFFGITVAMHYNDHAPSHFHALYGDREALVAIGTLECLGRHTAVWAMAMVLEWAALYRSRTEGKKADAARKLQELTARYGARGVDVRGVVERVSRESGE